MAAADAKARIKELWAAEGAARIESKKRRSELAALEQMVAKEEKAHVIKTWTEKVKEEVKEESSGNEEEEKKSDSSNSDEDNDVAAEAETVEAAVGKTASEAENVSTVEEEAAAEAEKVTTVEEEAAAEKTKVKAKAKPKGRPPGSKTRKRTAVDEVEASEKAAKVVVNRERRRRR